MDRDVEAPLAPALGALAVARILGDVGNQARIENALPIVCRIMGCPRVGDKDNMGQCSIRLP